jgi:hypothetical protein
MAGDTLAWRTITPGQKVLARDGADIGTVARVLADEGADIFHGVALRLAGEEREVVASQIERISEDAVHTTLAAAELESLAAPPGA